MESHLGILSESLDKKLELLRKIQDYNKRQEECFTAGNADISGFDAAIEEKGRLIEEVRRLDAGFEALYAELAKELETNRGQYAGEIRLLQEKVAAVTDMSVTVQAQEARNKKLIEQYFAGQRREIRNGRVASRAALDYYKSMNNTNHVPPQFMDSKQ